MDAVNVVSSALPGRDAGKQHHVRDCLVCRRELDEMREQTLARKTELLARAEEIKGKVGENLRQNVEAAQKGHVDYATMEPALADGTLRPDADPEAVMFLFRTLWLGVLLLWLLSALWLPLLLLRGLAVQKR